MTTIVNAVNTALRSNDRGGINSLLDQLDQARAQIDSERAAVGSRQNLMRQILDRHGDILFGLESVESEIEDIDITEALTRLTQQQTAFEATLYTAGQISSISLLDFLR